MIYDTWDLGEKLKQDLQGKSTEEYLSELNKKTKSFQLQLQKIEQKGNEELDLLLLKELILSSQKLYLEIYQFLEICLSLRSYEAANEEYKGWLAEINHLHGIYEECKTELDSFLGRLSVESFTALLEEKELKALAFILQERRQMNLNRKNAEVEKAYQSLEAFGLHAWGDLYTTITSQITFSVHEKGQSRELSLSEFGKTVYYGTERERRIAYFEQYKARWQAEASMCATAMNNIAGYRLKKYEALGYESPLTESLQQNRIKEQTVQAMWRAVESHKQPIIDYLKRKQELFQATTLSWSDQLAPLPSLTQESKMSFQQAIGFITKHTRTFDQEVADFIQHCAEQHWIDAVVSKNKSVGAFCASFPQWQEPRIMMSFQDDLTNTGVLAHELGHAYHYHLLYELPMFLQDIPPTVAEIASTLTETMVMRAAVSQTSSIPEKVQLLDYQIIRDIGTIQNIYVRYLFELSFYEERKRGHVSVERLNELMLHAQRQAFDGVFDAYDPTFWASLRHFYMTSKPFVHYPYTVAHLLSTGIYAKIAGEEDRGDRLRHILKDSTSLTIEAIGRKHLGVDLQHEDFWRSALDKIYENVHLFIELTEAK